MADTVSYPSNRYTTVAIALHWVIAIAILGQIASGVWMVDFAGETAARFTVYQLHKTAGLIVLALSLARLLWRFTHRPPELPLGMKAWEEKVAHLTHVAFYGLMILVPLSGWVMVSVSPTVVPTFLFMIEQLPFAHLPVGFGQSPEALHEAEKALKLIHKGLAIATALLFLGHVGAALKHQFIAKDGLIMRMVPVGRPLVEQREGIALLAALIVVGFVGAGLWAGGAQRGDQSREAANIVIADAPAQAWSVDPEVSSIAIELYYTGQTIAADLARWSANITFEPKDLAGSSATVVFDMGSLTIDDATLNAQSAGADGFDVASFPTATFETNSFSTVDKGFLAEGTLTIKGISVPVSLPFTFEENDGAAKVTGEAALDRTAFQIGMMGAPDESWLKNAVLVRIALVATRGNE